MTSSSAIGRIDVFGADENGTGETYVIVGANYQPEKALSIAPNIIMSDPENQDANFTYRMSFRFTI